MQYMNIKRQQPILMGAEQYLTDWWGPHVPYNFPEVTKHLIWCIENDVEEERFKLDIHRKYLL
jgi:hypothetical protein